MPKKKRRLNERLRKQLKHCDKVETKATHKEKWKKIVDSTYKRMWGNYSLVLVGANWFSLPKINWATIRTQIGYFFFKLNFVFLTRQKLQRQLSFTQWWVGVEYCFPVISSETLHYFAGTRTLEYWIILFLAQEASKAMETILLIHRMVFWLNILSEHGANVCG